MVVELPALMAERAISLRTLAQAAGVSASYLSRVLRQVEYKAPSAKLARDIASALGLPHDYFMEYRRAFVLDRIRNDQALMEHLYRELTGASEE
jgi:transcriptional regulator with XRE-family HTH domain